MLEAISFVPIVSGLILCGMALCAIIVFGEITLRHKRARDEARAERDAVKNERESLTGELKLRTSTGHDLAQTVDWYSQPLMNKSEFQVYCGLSDVVAKSPNGHRLFSQVSFGAFLRVNARRGPQRQRDAAFHAVARKTADFLIINRYGYPVAVVEYQGSGHYQGNAHDRDQAKRVACHSAGIPFIEISARGLSEGQRRDILTRLSTRPSIAAE